MRALAALTPEQLAARAVAKLEEDAAWEARILASDEERHRLAKAFIAEKAARDAKEHAKWAAAKALRTGHLDVCRFHILLRRAQAEHAAKGDVCLKSLLHYQGPRGDARTITVADALEGCYSKAKGKCPFLHEDEHSVAAPAPTVVPDSQFRQFDLGSRAGPTPASAAATPASLSPSKCAARPAGCRQFDLGPRAAPIGRENACRQTARPAARGGAGGPTPPPVVTTPRPAPVAPVDPLTWLKQQQRAEVARQAALTPEQWRAEEEKTRTAAIAEAKRAEKTQETLDSQRGKGRRAGRVEQFEGQNWQNSAYRGAGSGSGGAEELAEQKIDEYVAAFGSALQGPQAVNASFISVQEGSRRSDKIYAAQCERERKVAGEAAFAAEDWETCLRLGVGDANEMRRKIKFARAARMQREEQEDEERRQAVEARQKAEGYTLDDLFSRR